MTVIVEEAWDSPRVTEGSNPSVEVICLIHGTNDQSEALAALLDYTPATYNGLPRQSRSIERIAFDGWWRGTVTYSPKGQPPVDAPLWSFDTSGGTEKTTISFATARYPAPGKTAPDYGGAIGITDNGIEGVDVTRPKLDLSLRLVLPSTYMTPAYINILYSTTGCVNNAPWKGFFAGEVLFLGVAASQKSEEQWDLDYKFAVSPNRSNFYVGPILVPLKRGWDYLEVLYEDKVDTTAKRGVKYPLCVFVHQVYPYADFSVLLV